MAAKSTRSVPIKYREVLDAYLFVSAGMQSEHQAFICKTTGTIYYSSDAIDEEEELPDDLETSDTYVSVPHRNELDLGRDLVFSFVGHELPDERDTVRGMFGDGVPTAGSRICCSLTACWRNGTSSNRVPPRRLCAHGAKTAAFN